MLKTRGTRNEVALSGVRQEYLYICVRKMHEDGYAIIETCDILNLNRFYRLVHISRPVFAVICRKRPALSAV